MVDNRKKARTFPSCFKRNLPHIQSDGRTYLVTFCTHDRWTLQKSARSIVLSHCLHDQGTTMQLHAAVVMPDHVHLLLTPLNDPDGRPYTLSEIVGGIKGASAHSINRALVRRGPVWQDESFDHLLRQDEDMMQKADYICLNPVRKGLCDFPDDYPWIWRAWIEGQQ